MTTPLVTGTDYGGDDPGPAPGLHVVPVPGEVIGDRQAEEEAVEAIHDPAVAREQRAEVLEPEVALDHRLTEITKQRADCHERAEHEPVLVRPWRDRTGSQPAQDDRSRHTAHGSCH